MTTPLAGLPYPADINAQANGPAQFEALARKTDSRVVPPYPNNGARDAAFQAWAAVAGNAMGNGLMCTVAGWPLVYRNGAWRGISPGPVHEGQGPGTFGPYSNQGAPDPGLVVGRINIPDPGYEYRVHVDAAVEAYVVNPDGSLPSAPLAHRVDSIMNFAGVYFDVFRGDVGNLHKHQGISPNTASGASILNMLVYRPSVVASSGNYSTSASNFWMRCQVMPA